LSGCFYYSSEEIDAVLKTSTKFAKG